MRSSSPNVCITITATGEFSPSGELQKRRQQLLAVVKAALQLMRRPPSFQSAMSMPQVSQDLTGEGLLRLELADIPTSPSQTPSPPYLRSVYPAGGQVPAMRFVSFYYVLWAQLGGT
jgi:hypothetical protein